MRKLLLVTMILATVVACGKNNKVDSATATTTTTTTTTSTNPITVNDSVAQQLGSYVDNDSTMFGNGQATYYESWNQVVSRMPNTTYKYTTASSVYAAANCQKKWGFVYVCSNSSSQTASLPVSRKVIHSSVDITAKRNEIKAIINSSAAGTIQVSGTTYYIKNASTGVWYAIDLALPIHANPRGIQQADGKVEYFFGVE